MSNSENGRELWSDFDGTAVGLKGKADPRNWLKYPLPLIEGYPDFLDGVRSEGIDSIGVISRRPNIAPRRKVTELSIATLGLTKYFENSSVVLAGSEAAKAAHVVERAKEASVGLIDDKPHRVGAEIIKLMGETDENLIITLGAVAHDKQAEYVGRLIGSAEETIMMEVEVPHYTSYRLWLGRSVLQVVQMEPYSVESGQHFAQHLVSNY